MGHARNLAVVSSGDAVIAIGGGYGTLSEIGLAAKIGRPVVIVGGWRLQNDDAAEGVRVRGLGPRSGDSGVRRTGCTNRRPQRDNAAFMIARPPTPR